ncbi:hypothetical protein KIOSHI_44 [Bacillus phage Kioshi]|nr:hypothetical protein KIOSHI_44 [Bacillus phage Kioshi]
MKEILDVLYNASATLQDVQHDLATGKATLEDDFVAGELHYVIEQLQGVVGQVEGSTEAPVKEKKETLNEFIQRVTNSFEFAHETIREMWLQGFEDAIKVLESKRGYAGCLIPATSGMIQGKLHVTSDLITFVAGETKFVFEKTTNVSSAEVEEDEDEEDNEDRWEDEESPCESCNCAYYCHDQSTLLEYIKEQEEQKGDLTLKNLKMIEEHLLGKANFDADDYELVRYYLKANPQASAHEVDTLSEFGLRLAWNARLYLAGRL